MKARENAGDQVVNLIGRKSGASFFNQSHKVKQNQSSSVTQKG